MVLFCEGNLIVMGASVCIHIPRRTIQLIGLLGPLGEVMLEKYALNWF